MNKKQNNKQELSYFRLKLRSYMSEHHPERLKDTEFITARADMALTAYCDAVAQGFTHPEAVVISRCNSAAVRYFCSRSGCSAS